MQNHSHHQMTLAAATSSAAVASSQPQTLSSQMSYAYRNQFVDPSLSYTPTQVPVGGGGGGGYHHHHHYHHPQVVETLDSLNAAAAHQLHTFFLQQQQRAPQKLLTQHEQDYLALCMQLSLIQPQQQLQHQQQSMGQINTKVNHANDMTNVHYSNPHMLLSDQRASSQRGEFLHTGQQQQQQQQQQQLQQQQQSMMIMNRPSASPSPPQPASTAAAAQKSHYFHQQNPQLDNELNDLTVILSTLIAEEQSKAETATADLMAANTASTSSSQRGNNLTYGGGSGAALSSVTTTAPCFQLDASFDKTSRGNQGCSDGNSNTFSLYCGGGGGAELTPAAATSRRNQLSVVNINATTATRQTNLINHTRAKSAFRKSSAVKKERETAQQVKITQSPIVDEEDHRTAAAAAASVVTPPATNPVPSVPQQEEEMVDILSYVTSLLLGKKSTTVAAPPALQSQAPLSSTVDGTVLRSESTAAAASSLVKKAISKNKRGGAKKITVKSSEVAAVPSYQVFSSPFPAAAAAASATSPFSGHTSQLITPRNRNCNSSSHSGGSNSVGFKRLRETTSTAVTPQNNSQVQPHLTNTAASGAPRIGHGSAFSLVNGSSYVSKNRLRTPNISSVKSSHVTTPHRSVTPVVPQSMDIEDDMKVAIDSANRLLNEESRFTAAAATSCVNVSNIQEANNLITQVLSGGGSDATMHCYSGGSPTRCDSYNIEEEKLQKQSQLLTTKKILSHEIYHCSPSSITSEAVIMNSGGVKGGTTINNDSPQPLISPSPTTTTITTSKPAMNVVVPLKKRRTEVEKLLQAVIERKRKGSACMSSASSSSPSPPPSTVSSPRSSPHRMITKAKKAAATSCASSNRPVRMLNITEKSESVIKPAEGNDELFTNMDGFSEATQNLMSAFEKEHLKQLASYTTAPHLTADFRNFMRTAKKNDEHISLLLNPRACVYSTAFLEFLRGPALEWIRRHVEQRKQSVYVQLIQIFRSEDRSISALRPRKDRSLLSNLSLRKQ